MDLQVLTALSPLVQAITAIVVAAATVVLVVITRRYVELTRRIAEDAGIRLRISETDLELKKIEFQQIIGDLAEWALESEPGAPAYSPAEVRIVGRRLIELGMLFKVSVSTMDEFLEVINEAIKSKVSGVDLPEDRFRYLAALGIKLRLQLFPPHKQTEIWDLMLKELLPKSDPELVRKGVVDGSISIEAARERYRVALDPRTLAVDVEATKALREANRKAANIEQK